ncbi:hypothetical protein NGRA_2735 [Nosema granulosis]|uniref:Uncharacterized protein n=1 Tax=Nosema granulosis TaxID=83296 RepID=A0A9P6GWJ2_9MICR|nr:hypothetical protein NGRA_2735 [Nosema granulosis]
METLFLFFLVLLVQTSNTISDEYDDDRNSISDSEKSPYESTTYTFKVKIYVIQDYEEYNDEKRGFGAEILSFQNQLLFSNQYKHFKNVEIIENTRNDAIAIIPKEEFDDLDLSTPFRFIMHSRFYKEKLFVSDLLLINNGTLLNFEKTTTKHIELFTYILADLRCLSFNEMGPEHKIKDIIDQNPTVFRPFKSTEFLKKKLQHKDFFNVLDIIAKYSFGYGRYDKGFEKFTEFLNSLDGLDYTSKKWKEHLTILSVTLAIVESCIRNVNLSKYIYILTERVPTLEDLEILISSLKRKNSSKYSYEPHMICRPAVNDIGKQYKQVLKFQKENCSVQ